MNSINRSRSALARRAVFRSAIVLIAIKLKGVRHQLKKDKRKSNKLSKLMKEQMEA